MKSIFDVQPDEADDSGSDMDDARPVDDSAPDESDATGGPFEAYAQTALDPEAEPAARTDALRQAIMTLMESKG